MKWLETIPGQVTGHCTDPALVTQESPWRAPTFLDRETPPSGGCRCAACSSESGPEPPPVPKNIAAADGNSQGGNSRESPGKEDSTGEAASALPVGTNTSWRVLSGFLKTSGNSFPPPYFSVSFWGLYQTPEISKDYVLASDRRAGINVRLAAAQSLKPSPGLCMAAQPWPLRCSRQTRTLSNSGLHLNPTLLMPVQAPYILWSANRSQFSQLSDSSVRQEEQSAVPRPEEGIMCLGEASFP